jgi:hypothetical protein
MTNKQKCGIRVKKILKNLKIKFIKNKYNYLFFIIYLYIYI